MGGADGNLRDSKGCFLIAEALRQKGLVDTQLLYRLMAEMLCADFSYVGMLEGGEPGDETALMLLAKVLYRILASGGIARQIYEPLGNELRVKVAGKRQYLFSIELLGKYRVWSTLPSRLQSWPRH